MNLVMMISVINILFYFLKTINSVYGSNFKNFVVDINSFFIGSCSSKPELEPKPSAKVKSKKPAWTDGKIKSIGEWYGVSSGEVGDTLDLVKEANYLIEQQVYEKIKETIKHDLDLSESIS